MFCASACDRLRPTAPWIAYIAVAWIVAVDAPSLVSLGPVSLSGFATLAIAVMAVGLAPAYWWVRRASPAHGLLEALPGAASQGVLLPWPLALFMAWAIGHLAVVLTGAGAVIDPVQSVAAYLAFGGSIAMMSTSSIEAISRVRRLYVVAGWILVAVALVGLTLPGLALYGDRSLALTAMVLQAAVIPDRSSRFAVRALPYALVVVVALTLSRTALTVATLMLPFLVLRGPRTARVLRWCLLGAGAVWLLWLLVANYEPLQQRFETGDNYRVGGVALNTSGRERIWSVLLGSLREGDPLLGQGPGTTEVVLSRSGILQQPHNDYLRLAHDFGYVGLILFAAGLAMLMWRSWRAARRSSGEESDLHWSSVLATGAVAIAALTDNVLVYAFVMVPLGVLVGMSVARLSSPETGSVAANPRQRAGARTYR